MRAKYDIFISAKNLDSEGHRTKDSILADTLHDFLSGKGFSVFCSNKSLEERGIAAYQEAIDSALDSVKVVIVVGTSKKNLESRWVRYEWSSFFNDILSGTNPEGRVPRALRITQCIEHGPDSFEKLSRFIGNVSAPKNGVVGSLITDETYSPKTMTLNGSWKGSWQRYKGTIRYDGSLSIHQDGSVLEALLNISFTKRGTLSVIEEHLVGEVTSSHIILKGISYSYLEQGLSVSYLLDNFILNSDNTGEELRGQFYSKKGTGEANFVRTDEKPHKSGNP